MDINITQIRSALKQRRGDWSAIAKDTGVSEKTLHRIANRMDYFPNLRTAEQITGWLSSRRARK